ncbi:MAG: hypothetical protein H6697_02360 [Myxococcales bacterium]|nr:hypothetical protein [Myxococcales bacterium]
MTGYDRTDLLLLGNWSHTQIALFATLALGLCVLTWLDVRDLPRPRGPILVALRALALALALALLLEPALEQKDVSLVRNHVAVLVDVSESEALPTPDGRTRLDRARDAVAAMRLSPDDPEHEFEVIAFDDGGTPITPTALQTTPAAGQATHTLETLEQVASRLGPRALGGVVIVSDGIDNGALGSRVRRGDPLDAQTADALQRLGAPVHTIATGAADELRDIAVTAVDYDEFAFVRNVVAVSAELRVLGFRASDGDLDVTLSRDGAPLQTRRLSLVDGQRDYRVEFEFVPEQIGTEVYSVSTPVRPGEALSANNREWFVLRVIRDKIRALQVVGRPSWDVRFLRQLLQSNPNVDLINFFILRTQEDVQRGSERDLSLIPFPTEELFDQQLGSFDVVIFQNFDYGPYDMQRYLPRIRDYVRNGGGFVMIGGDRSFGAGGYGSTVIADLLPVTLPASRGADSIDLGSFRPTLTAAGRRHPITRVEFDPARNASVWDTLPVWNGTNRVLGPRDGAVVLATHPTLRGANGEPMPVIAVADVEKGRTMAVTSDGTWRWSFDRVGRGEGSGPYSAFWNSAIRWLIRDPELNLIDVAIPDPVVELAPGATVDLPITVRVFEPDYTPAAGEHASVTISRRALDGADGDAAELVQQTSLDIDDGGRAALRLSIDTPGAYEVVADAPLADGTERRDREVFLVLPRSRELRDIEPRPDLLAALAEAGGGRAVGPHDAVGNLEFLPAQVEQVDRREVVELWSSPWTLALLALILGGEWSLRRRWGRL